MLFRSRDANVPAWEDFPYDCENEICARLLPKCTARRIILRCDDRSCRLHNPERWRIQTHGTMRDLLDRLSAWTCPVREWEITMQTPVMESLGELSYETQRVWEEIARVFAQSCAVWPRGVRIESHVDGVGRLALNALKGTCASRVSLLRVADLMALQTAILSDTVCGPDSTPWTTAHWPICLTSYRTSLCAVSLTTTLE